MGNLYAVAGRPLSGKTQYLQRLKNKLGLQCLYVSAKDYADFDQMMNSLAKAVMDTDTINTIAIDDLEYKLVEDWKERIDEEEYRKNLQILAGFADNYDLDIYFAVGLKREADRENQIYFTEKYLRAREVTEETDGVLFLKKRVLRASNQQKNENQ